MAGVDSNILRSLLHTAVAQSLVLPQVPLGFVFPSSSFVLQWFPYMFSLDFLIDDGLADVCGKAQVEDSNWH